MDYAIYRLTPSSSHSEFCVRVISDSMDDNGNDWRSISTITRVMPVCDAILFLLLLLTIIVVGSLTGCHENLHIERCQFSTLY